jgi:hypothetical protein
VNISLLTHPLTTFLAGIAVTLVSLVCFLNMAKEPNRSAAAVADYHRAMNRAGASNFIAGGADEVAALKRFKDFLVGIGSSKYISENALKVYASDAYLDDTLTVHHGAAAIEEYFQRTAETMTNCQVSIDDASRSGGDYYMRWTMIFAAPGMSGGSQVHSVGISQVRFNREGKVTFHRDFWDSGKNFYAHLPIAGGVIGFIHKRLKP